MEADDGELKLGVITAGTTHPLMKTGNMTAKVCHERLLRGRARK